MSLQILPGKFPRFACHRKITMPQRTLCAYIIALVFLTASLIGCRASRALSPDAGRGAASQTASGHITKQVSFSILEDYDKGKI